MPSSRGDLCILVVGDTRSPLRSRKGCSRMRLIVNRSQQPLKGMLGGSKGVQFTLRCRLELTQEEAELVRVYRLDEYPLTYRSVQGDRVPGETISSLVRGSSQTITDVTTLIANENVVKKACDELPVLFEVARSFGGDEIIEYPRNGNAVAPRTSSSP